MKKLVILCALILSMTSGVFAQDVKDSPIYGGKIGMSFFAGEQLAEMMMNDSMNINIFRTAGCLLNIHVTDFLAIEPGFYYSMSNTKNRTETTGSSTSSETTGKYRTAGADLAFMFYINMAANTYMYVGPRADYMYQNKRSDDASGTYNISKTNTIGGVGVIGIKYMLTKNLAIFGDVDGGYTHSNTTCNYYNAAGTQTSTRKNYTDSFSFNKTTIGVTLYLN